MDLALALRSFEDHKIELVADHPGVRVVRMARPDSGVYRVQLTETCEGIVIQGDCSVERNCTGTPAGYTLDWFARASSPQYLGEKFLKQGWHPKLAEDGIREWLSDEGYWNDTIRSLVEQDLKERDKRKGSSTPELDRLLGRQPKQPWDTILKCESCGHDDIEDDDFAIGKPCPEWVDKSPKRGDEELDERKCGGNVVVHELGRVDEAMGELREALEDLCDGLEGEHGPFSLREKLGDLGLWGMEGEDYPGWGYDPVEIIWLQAIQQTFSRLWIERIETLRRPTEAQARAAINEMLMEHIPALPDDYELAALCEDGDWYSAKQKCGWAFALMEGDTTSYVHEDLEIEWYGTSWEPTDG